MAVKNPARFLNSEDHDAAGDRQLLETIFGNTSTCFHTPTGTTGYLAVTEKPTPAMSVDVAPGRCFIVGTESPSQGGYFCVSENIESLVIDNGDGSNDRIDIVEAKIEDAEYTGVVNAWSLSVKKGQPSGSPAAPVPSANAIVLAEIYVPLGRATSITNSDITDKRPGTSVLRFGGPSGISWYEIPDGSIGTDQLADNSVTASKLAPVIRPKFYGQIWTGNVNSPTLIPATYGSICGFGDNGSFFFTPEWNVGGWTVEAAHLNPEPLVIPKDGYYTVTVSQRWAGFFGPDSRAFSLMINGVMTLLDGPFHNRPIKMQQGGFTIGVAEVEDVRTLHVKFEENDTLEIVTWNYGLTDQGCSSYVQLVWVDDL